MSARLTTWFPLLILVVLAAVTFWLNQKAQSPESAHSKNQRHDPDVTMQNFSVVQMGVGGEILYTLTAKNMSHYPDDESTNLVAPELIYAEKPRAPLKIVSKRALLSRDGENIYFHEDVRLSHSPLHKQGEMILTTEFLHVIPDQGIAKTDRFVSITKPGANITAVGMEFNWATSIIKLLSKSIILKP